MSKICDYEYHFNKENKLSLKNQDVINSNIDGYKYINRIDKSNMYEVKNWSSEDGLSSCKIVCTNQTDKSHNKCIFHSSRRKSSEKFRSKYKEKINSSDSGYIPAIGWRFPQSTDYTHWHDVSVFIDCIIDICNLTTQDIIDSNITYKLTLDSKENNKLITKNINIINSNTKYIKLDPTDNGKNTINIINSNADLLTTERKGDMAPKDRMDPNNFNIFDSHIESIVLINNNKLKETLDGSIIDSSVDSFISNMKFYELKIRNVNNKKPFFVPFISNGEIGEKAKITLFDLNKEERGKFISEKYENDQFAVYIKEQYSESPSYKQERYQTTNTVKSISESKKEKCFEDNIKQPFIDKSIDQTFNLELTSIDNIAIMTKNLTITNTTLNILPSPDNLNDLYSISNISTEKIYRPHRKKELKKSVISSLKTNVNTIGIGGYQKKINKLEDKYNEDSYTDQIRNKIKFKTDYYTELKVPVFGLIVLFLCSTVISYSITNGGIWIHLSQGLQIMMGTYPRELPTILSITQLARYILLALFIKVLY